MDVRKISVDAINARRQNESENLIGRKWETHKVVFYPEDVEKIKTMTLEERIDYQRYLKRENRYTYEE
ncbi:MAG: hypothetical protein LBT83_11495 [Tannerella sp.]|jgi:hypothetical protein|nr:hypothetical protein [Tannerella sp.]